MSEPGLRQASKIIEGLNEVIVPGQNVQIALETMAGKGSECGRSFEELAEIIAGVTHNEHLSVCFDTCHTHDAGYDVANDFDGVLNEFDKIVGIDRIKVLHVNDSKILKAPGKTAMKISGSERSVLTLCSTSFITSSLPIFRKSSKHRM